MFDDYAVLIHDGQDIKGFNGRSFLIRVNDLTFEDILKEIENSGISLEDLRAKTLCNFQHNSLQSLLLYIALSDFAGRWLDLFDGVKRLEAGNIFDDFQKLIPDRPIHEKDDLLMLCLDDRSLISNNVLYYPSLSNDELVRVSFAKNLLISFSSISLTEIASCIIAVSSLRNRNSISRQPNLAISSDERDSDINLEHLRRIMQEYRRKRKLGNRDAVIAKSEISDPRLIQFQIASSYPVEEILQRLGTIQNPDTGMYHCTRPDRHTNGDRTPSTKVTDGKVQCLRCDGERLDSLRLVIDTLNLSPDEAVDWILS